MKRVRPIFASLLAALLLLLPPAICCATTCVRLPPLKPVHSICGVVFFPSGDRIANAKVTVLQAGQEIAVQETDNDGKFSFDHLEAGKYEIRVRVEAVPVVATDVVLVRPQSKPKREKAVSMMSQGCSSFSLVDRKKFEAGLNPRSSSTDTDSLKKHKDNAETQRTQNQRRQEKEKLNAETQSRKE